MKKIISITVLAAVLLCFFGLGATGAIKADLKSAATKAVKKEIEASKENEKKNAEKFNVKITVGKRELTAVLENNATTRYLVERMPMTLPMLDLYDREMCYRYGANALPTERLQSDGYEVGDIVYWAPGGSLVILYRQNGEQFERQHLGRIESGVDLFKTTGDVNVTFELIPQTEK